MAVRKIAGPIRCTVLAALLAVGLMSAPKAAGAEELLCSTFPVFLLTRAVTDGSRHYQPGLMLESTLGCPHDYAPTPAELSRLSRAKVLVINGLGLESFLGRTLAAVAGPDIKVLDASGGGADGARSALLLDRNEAVEGALKFAHDHGAEAPGADQGHGGTNAHFFASPSTAAIMADNIGAGLARLDPPNARTYQANASALAAELRALAAAMKEAGLKLGRPKVIVSHGLFDYLAQDLGLEIVGYLEEADGAEPSAAHLTKLTELTRRGEVRAILINPESRTILAETLSRESGVPVVRLDPVASGPADAPPDYYQQVMAANLAKIVAALAGGENK